MRDYDEVTAFLGQRGPYFWTIFSLLNIIYISMGYSGLYIVFVGATPAHWCRIPDDANISQDWREASIPVEMANGKAQRSRCSRYRLDVIRNLSRFSYVPGVDMNVTSLELESCHDGWVYSNETFHSSIVTEWDLVCDNAWKVPFTTSTFFIGFLVGSVVSGQLSDRFGRKIVLFVSLAEHFAFILLHAYSSSWEVFCVLFSAVGFANTSVYLSAFVLGTETLSQSMRVLFTTLGTFLHYSTGYMLLPCIAFGLRDWRSLLFALSGINAVYFPLWWFISESPRWLLSQGRVEEAVVILKHAAKKNKSEAPEVFFSDSELENMTSKRTKKHGIVDILRTSNVRAITTTCLLLWLSVNMGYYGLSLNSTNLSGDPYLNCFLSAVTEVPAYITSSLILRRWPRRAILSTCLFASGAVLLLIQLVPEDLQMLALSLELVSKFSFTISLCVVYNYIAEVYPTVLRNVGIGVCSSAARIGCIVAPYILYLGCFYRFLPYIVMGSLSIGSCTINIFLPETLNKQLPDTVEQMEDFRWICTGNKRNKLSVDGKSNPVVVTEDEL